MYFKKLFINIALLFFQVFGPLLQGLYRSMQGASVVGNGHRKPLEGLSELVELRSGPAGNLRPICTLITHQVILYSFFIFVLIVYKYVYLLQLLIYYT